MKTNLIFVELVILRLLRTYYRKQIYKQVWTAGVNQLITKDQHKTKYNNFCLPCSNSTGLYVVTMQISIFYRFFNDSVNNVTQSSITCSKLTIETQEQGVKYVQSLQENYFTVNFDHIFSPCSRVSIVNFEQVSADWVPIKNQSSYTP